MCSQVITMIGQSRWWIMIVVPIDVWQICFPRCNILAGKQNPQFSVTNLDPHNLWHSQWRALVSFFSSANSKCSKPFWTTSVFVSASKQLAPGMASIKKSASPEDILAAPMAIRLSKMMWRNPMVGPFGCEDFPLEMYFSLSLIRYEDMFWSIQTYWSFGVVHKFLSRTWWNLNFFLNDFLRYDYSGRWWSNLKKSCWSGVDPPLHLIFPVVPISFGESLLE